jgi:outer membrane protein TolC
LLRAEQAREAQVKRELDAGLQRSNAALEGAWEVAGKTPEQVVAARATLEQASARYRAGLGTIVEVAEAQRLLTQAETGDSLARLQVWRALLAVAAAQGDLGSFLQTAAQ